MKMLDQKLVGFTLVLIGVFLMVFAQLLLKSRLNIYGAIPFKPSDFVSYFWQLMQDWKVWVGGIGLVISALLWYSAVSRIQLSVAFTISAMSYPLIFIASIVLLGEDFSYAKLLANLLIVSGVLIIGFSNS